MAHQQPPNQQQLQQWFQSVDTDRSGQIDARELHRCLQMGGQTFDFHVCRRLIQTFDTDRSGQIGFQEFLGLHNYLGQMRAAFEYFDTDKGGTLDANELTQALHRSGYQLSPHAVGGLMSRFDVDKSGSFSYDEYIGICVYLGSIRNLCAFYDPQRTGTVHMTFDQLIACSPFFA